MGFFDIFRRKNEDGEAKRREFLQTKGRIADGTILETQTSDAGEEIISYYYSVQGVSFESSEILGKNHDSNKYTAGAKVGIRFDPRNHGNSILD